MVYLDSKDAVREYEWSFGYSRQWILRHWGNPDRTYSKNGIDYLVYEKKSRYAPKFQLQQQGHVELAYRGNKLVSISAFFPNCPPYMRGPVYVLPK